MHTNLLMKPFKGTNYDYYTFNYFYAKYQASEGKHCQDAASELKKRLDEYLRKPVPQEYQYLGVGTLRELYEDNGQLFEIRWEDIPEEYTANRNLFREILDANDHQPVMFFSESLMKTIMFALDE